MKNSEKPKNENEWQNVWGETEVEFGPRGKTKITERKSGEVNEPQPVEKTSGQIAYDKLNEFEKKRVDAEMKKFEEKTPEMFQKGWLIEEINEESEKIKEEMSKKILELRKENTEK